MTVSNSTGIGWLPDFIYLNGRFESNLAMFADLSGRITRFSGEPDDLAAAERLPNRAILPGLVNVHSHTFQRLIRGRTEYRTSFRRTATGAAKSAERRTPGDALRADSNVVRDTFWTWRESMYRAANSVTPEAIYRTARMAFLEMALSGITTVGEFHYVHHQPGGVPYENRNVLALLILRAAEEIGIRIALLRTAYVRAGWNKDPDPGQIRFMTPSVDDFLRDTDDLRKTVEQLTNSRGTQAPTQSRAHQGAVDAPLETQSRAPLDTPRVAASSGAGPYPAEGPPHQTSAPRAWVAVAPHSVRAVPLNYLLEVAAYARANRLPLHMHLAEQPAEIEACLGEYNCRPVELLAREGLLDPRFTAIHAIHITPEEAGLLGAAHANICACPTSERSLGDGAVPADRLFDAGASICFGSDSNIQIDVLEDARELEYHLRMKKLERVILAGDDSDRSSLARRLFESATRSGARSLHSPAGEFAAGFNDGSAAPFSDGFAARFSDGSEASTLDIGRPADFFTVDLNDPSIAGADADSLLNCVVFSLERTAIRDVFVNGQRIIHDGRHALQDEIVAEFIAVRLEL